jgi:hypothetical protein
MRSLPLNAILLAAALVGCSTRHDSATHSQTHAAPATTNPQTSLAGTWHWVDEKAEVELSADGHWRWWKLKEQSGRASEQPFMSGRWFVHEHDLYLRIDQHADAGLRGVATGMAMIFALESVALDTLRLNWLRADRDVTWARVGAHN